MGCAGSRRGGGDGSEMTGRGKYYNLNPYIFKQQSAEFRQKLTEALLSISKQGLGAECGCVCDVVRGGMDANGTPLEIEEADLRTVADVLRVFSAGVRNEIVGACLLARPADVQMHGHDYSKSAVLTLQAQHSIVSAAVLTLRIMSSTVRCFEVIWVATRKSYERNGYATILFGYVQQIAALWGIEAVLVLSSRTSVGFWLGQPRPSGLPPIIFVRSPESSKRLRKGYSKYPWKLQKLERGLHSCKTAENPPEEVRRFYSDKSPFRFDHARSIHVWFEMGLSSVDYIQLAYSSTGTRGRSKSKPRPSLQYTSSKSSAGAAKDSHSRRRSSSGKHGMDGSPYHVAGHGSKSGESTKGKPRRQKSGNKNLSMSSVSSAKKAARKLRARKSKQ